MITEATGSFGSSGAVLLVLLVLWIPLYAYYKWDTRPSKRRRRTAEVGPYILSTRPPEVTAADPAALALGLASPWAARAGVPWDDLRIPREAAARALYREFGVADSDAQREAVRGRVAADSRRLVEEMWPVVQFELDDLTVPEDCEPDPDDCPRHTWELGRIAWLVRCGTGIGAFSVEHGRRILADLSEFAQSCGISIDNCWFDLNSHEDDLTTLAAEEGRPAPNFGPDIPWLWWGLAEVPGAPGQLELTGVPVHDDIAPVRPVALRLSSLSSS